MTNGHKPIEVAGYGGACATASEIDRAVLNAWQEILEDPASRDRAAALLGVTSKELPSTAPFVAKPKGSGLTGVETILVLMAWDFAKDVGYDMAKDAAKDALSRGAKALWTGLVKPRAEGRLPAGAIGREIPVPDDVQ
jgi:hypothetical protein